MGKDTEKGKEAMARLEEVVHRASRTAADPGLRKRYAELPRLPIRIVCCPLDKGINHGNILRIAECFRVERVSFAPVSEEKEKDLSGGFAALKWQPREWKEPRVALEEAKLSGYRAYGLTLGEASRPVHAVDWCFPAVLAVGRELEGLDPEVAAACDEFVGIPLFGIVESLNVAVATGIALWEMVKACINEHPHLEPARALQREMLRKACDHNSGAPGK
jgi:tRNA G18 (ribose-2'-O)-methylase SpoU